MSYLVLARKFRPQNFANVIGQEHIRKVLKNSLKRNKVAHAYIFAGPRGVGKTSLARIFAKSLNCQNINDGEPCLECANCMEISQGISLAVREIDGASNNSVENVRELIDNFRSLPPPGSKFKVYIIDEVHMLSTSAFNALLKSLEEPPPNTIFILATTEVHKIPETVVSRCQRHDFRSIDLATIEKSLDQIIKAEGRKAESGVTRLISRYSEGSLRDSQSLLERIMAYSDDETEQVNVEAARQILGVAGPAQLEEIWQAIRNEDANSALNLLSEVYRSGVDSTRFLKEFVESIRAEFQKAVSDKNSSSTELLELEQLLSIATRGADSALRSVFIEAALESLVVRLCLRRMRDKQPSTPGGPSNNPLLGRKSSKEAVSSKVIEMQPRMDSTRNSTAQDLQPGSESTQISSSKAMEWESFLASSEINCQPMLLEHLRRLEIKKFNIGELIAFGPEFSIDYLQKQDSLNKLQQELKHLCKKSEGIETTWRITFSKQSGASNSLHERELAASRERAAEKHKSTLDHPSVKSLQRAFPGSNVAKVVVRK